MTNVFVSLSNVSIKTLPWLRWAVILGLLGLALLAPTAVHACDMGHGICGG